MIAASPRRLTVFKNVVELGGFNLAAARLGIAQPSVGAHIKALESQIGQPLFDRQRGSKPLLTKAGHALYAYAVEVLRRSEETTDALAGLRQAAAREIAIALHRDVAAHLVPKRLAGFARKFPKIRIVTRIGTIEDVIDLVRKRTATLGLFLAAGPIRGIRSEVLAIEPLALVASPQHPLAVLGQLQPQDIGRYPVVTGLRGSRYFELVAAALAAIGVADYEIAMELQESAAVKEMVRHGAGIACLPHCTVAAELASGALVELKASRQPPPLQLRCAYRGPLSDIARTFVLAMRGQT
jgi:DNA-binding transcriptional LysR family regulator